jgi:hypothetical protein
MCVTILDLNLKVGYSKSTVIDNVWLYSRYYGNQLAFLREVEGNGSAALTYLFNLLENILKSHLRTIGVRTKLN